MEGGTPRGLFVGLATLDVVHRVSAAPRSNEKVVALSSYLTPGGPATNAALTFAALGGRATLLTVLGTGSAADAVRAWLETAGVEVIDAAAAGYELSPASAFVVESTGERSVIGSGHRPDVIPPDVRALVEAVDVVLVDGHHPPLAVATADAAAERGRPVIVDMGSDKPVYAAIRQWSSDVICSADYRAPDGSSPAAMLALGPGLVAVSHGPDPLEWWTATAHGMVAVPSVDVVDTLGAGDALHGAYAYGLAVGLPRPDALVLAVGVAARRVTIAGTPGWWFDPRLRAAGHRGGC